jgi:hypothetical protein
VLVLHSVTCTTPTGMEPSLSVRGSGRSRGESEALAGARLGCFPRIAPLSLAGGRVRDGDPTANVRPGAERLPVGPSLGCSQTGVQHPAGVGAMTPP